MLVVVVAITSTTVVTVGDSEVEVEEVVGTSLEVLLTSVVTGLDGVTKAPLLHIMSLGVRTFSQNLFQAKVNSMSSILRIF